VWHKNSLAIVYRCWILATLKKILGYVLLVGGLLMFVYVWVLSVLSRLFSLSIAIFSKPYLILLHRSLGDVDSERLRGANICFVSQYFTVGVNFAFMNTYNHIISWPILRSYLYHCVWSVITALNLTPEKRDNNYSPHPLIPTSCLRKNIQLITGISPWTGCL